MAEIIGIRFKKSGKTYYFDPGPFVPRCGELMIVETARGLECGEVVVERCTLPDEKVVQPLKRVVRMASAGDRKTLEQNERFERDAFKICEERIARHGLEMKLVEVEYTFDRAKIVFYFSADGRVDFRELVKDLAQVFRTRIELRQIGVRDEAKMVGGLGICGRPLCCCSFMDEFQPVSINMAKDQGLSLNPTKISGTCGRLMCCLKFESESYRELLKTTPPPMSLVDTPSGRGTVLDSNLLRGTCRIRLNSAPDNPPITVSCAECRVLRAGKDRGDSAAIPAENTDFPLPPAEDTPMPADPVPQDDAAAAPQTERPARRRDDRPRGDRPQRPRPDRKPRPEGAPQQNARKPQPQSEAAPAADAPAAPAADGNAKRPPHRNHRGGRGGRRRTGGNRGTGGDSAPNTPPESPQ